MPSLSSTAAWALALLATVPLAATSACPPLGPVLPAPKFPSKSCDVQKATSLLRSSLQSSFEAQMKASAISVGVKSIHEDAALFNYHFTPPKMSGQGTNLVDEDTMYRVGSVSKLFPILMLLQSGKVSMDDSIVKYIPGLTAIQGTGVNRVSWEDITIGALASHLSGLGTDSMLFPCHFLSCKSPDSSLNLHASSGIRPCSLSRPCLGIHGPPRSPQGHWAKLLRPAWHQTLHHRGFHPRPGPPPTSLPL